jgi:DNA modification methylase
MKLNQIYQGDCLEVMKTFPDESIDLTVTSPPYDNLRDYKGYTFNFEGIAKELFRITKQGGVVVWVVGDATVNGSETGTSFKQALYFKEIGFNLHDTMIYEKSGIPFPSINRYSHCFEYMFVFCKDKIKTFNIIKDKINTNAGKPAHWGKPFWRNKEGNLVSKLDDRTTPQFGSRTNIWRYSTGKGNSTQDKEAYKHPAVFPEKLAEDHIKSWSNEGDIVLDPMCGSGTTCKMTKLNGRNFIGIEISPEYIKIAEQRIKEIPQKLF